VLIIHRSQVDAFRASLEEDFRRAVADELLRRCPEQCPPAEEIDGVVGPMIRRALAHGFRTEEEAWFYVLIALHYGAEFDVNCTWAIG
jgi:hypothetical protein